MPEEARAFPGYEFQGEYSGNAGEAYNSEDSVQVGLQVAVYGENFFRGIVYPGGLPGEHSDTEQEYYTVEGAYEDPSLNLEGDGPFSFRYSDGTFLVLDKDENTLGHLDPRQRESSTLGKEPPQNTTTLFDGTGIELWDEHTEMTDDGLLKQGATTAEKYGDIHLHVEAMLGFMPYHTGQSRANSGIYIQNRYEVQILDSFGLPPTIDGNGSLYNESRPLMNATLPPLTWQTYDIYFRAPRFNEVGNKTENARITAYLNGYLIQDDVELEQGTGAGAEREEVEQAELYLQDHTGPVRFRNIWIIKEDYSPPGDERL